MPPPMHEFLFSDLALTRDPITSLIDFDWEQFTKVIAASGIQPILMSEERELDFYVPMIITLYRYARAAGQPIDLAAEAINQDFDPYGTKEQVFRASVRQANVFMASTVGGHHCVRITIPEGVHFAHMALRAGTAAQPHFDGAVLHRILLHSQAAFAAFADDSLDIYAFLSQWYSLARLAGEPADPFMESIRDTVKFTLSICGSVPSMKARPSPTGLLFAAPIGLGEETVSVRVPVEVQWSDLALSSDESCTWAPLHQILSVSGLDAKVLGVGHPTSPMARVPVSAPIAALLQKWVLEAARVGAPIESALPTWLRTASV